MSAEAMLQEILKPVNDGVQNREKLAVTFAAFAETVYIPVFERKWKWSTAQTEGHRIRFHLVPQFGEKLMRDIKREQLQTFLDQLAKKSSRSLIDHLRFRLRSIFRFAMSEGVVERNPADALHTPRKCRPGRERRVLQPEQLSRALCAVDLREQVIIRLATICGMRPGEILALKLRDFRGAVLNVERRIYRFNLDEPKTDRSRREVALPKGTQELLELWIQKALITDPEQWLFPSERFTPLTRDNVWRRQLQPKLEMVGLQWANFQVMRRTYATWSKDIGVDAHTRSAQMGNTVDVNENEYAMATFEQKLAAVEKLETAVIQ
jgi:integrase